MVHKQELMLNQVFRLSITNFASFHECNASPTALNSHRTIALASLRPKTAPCSEANHTGWENAVDPMNLDGNHPSDSLSIIAGGKTYMSEVASSSSKYETILGGP